MRVAFIAALFFVPMAVVAQNPPANSPTTTVDPTNRACTANSALNYIPSGELFTCQNGTYQRGAGPVPSGTGVVVVNGGVETVIPAPASIQNANFVAVGDSRTCGLRDSVSPSACPTAPFTVNPSTGRDYLSVAMSLLSLSAHGTGTNTGVVGWTISQMQSDYTAHVHPLSPAVTGRPGYLLFNGGFNDVTISNSSAATIEGLLQTYYSTAVADGWQITTITIYAGAETAAQDKVRNDVNYWIKGHVGPTGTASVTNRVIDADLILPDPYDGNLFDSDFVHPKNGGYSALGHAVNEQIGADDNSLHTPVLTTLGLGAANFRYPWSAGTAMAGTGAFVSGYENWCVGSFACNNLTTGAGNTAFGANAGQGFTTGFFNTAYGDKTCATASFGNSGICLGYQADLGAGTTGAAQIGTGINSTDNTMQFQSWNFMDSSGNFFIKKVTQYNSISTVDNGVPAIYGHSDLTGQTAAQSAVALYTPAATGMFRVTYYAKVTTPGTTSILGGTTGFVLSYTGGTDSVAQNLTLTEANQSGSILSIGTGNITNTTAALIYGTATVFAKTGVSMTYNFGYTSTGTAMQYEIHVKVEAL